jgi:hypothetical protein
LRNLTKVFITPGTNTDDQLPNICLSMPKVRVGLCVLLPAQFKRAMTRQPEAAGASAPHALGANSTIL